MEKDDPNDLRARAAVIAAVNALIDTFLKKATRVDVDTLAGSQIFEEGMLLFRDSTGMPIEVRVTFGEHLDAEATAKIAGDAPATLVQPGFVQSIPIEEVVRGKGS